MHQGHNRNRHKVHIVEAETEPRTEDCVVVVHRMHCHYDFCKSSEDVSEAHIHAVTLGKSVGLVTGGMKIHDSDCAWILVTVDMVGKICVVSDNHNPMVHLEMVYQIWEM